MTDLKSQLLTALANSSATNPVDTSALAQGHQRGRVEAALMELYRDNKVCCCKIIKGGQERVVWWISGIVEYTGYYGKINIKAPTADYIKLKKEFKPRKRSELTISVLDHIKANPGWMASEIINHFSRAHDADQVRQSLGTLRNAGDLKIEGTRRQHRYYTTPQGDTNGHQ